MTVKRAAKWTGVGVAIATTFLIAREGFAPVARHERIDPPGVITWCFGRTNYDDPTVKAGTRFSKEECQRFLQEDLPKYAAPYYKCIPGFAEMGPRRQAALVSAGYNLGSERICKSSVGRNFRAGNVQAACDALLKFDRANGVVLRGLQLRRQAEREMCLRDD